MNTIYIQSKPGSTIGPTTVIVEIDDTCFHKCYDVTSKNKAAVRYVNAPRVVDWEYKDVAVNKNEKGGWF